MIRRLLLWLHWLNSYAVPKFHTRPPKIECAVARTNFCDCGHVRRPLLNGNKQLGYASGEDEGVAQRIYASGSLCELTITVRSYLITACSTVCISLLLFRIRNVRGDVRLNLKWFQTRYLMTERQKTGIHD
jgi:hypothetical protein